MAAHRLSSTEGGTSQDSKKKKMIGQWALTDCQAQREGQVRTLRESERARGTHRLLSTEAETSQDKRRQESKRHSQTGVHKGRDKLGQQDNAQEQGTLAP